MFDIVIIGSGPAGATAGIYAQRAGMKVLIVSKNEGALKKGGIIENYYGFPDPIDGEIIFNYGLQQAKNVGCTLIEDEVIDIQFDGENFTVKSKKDSFVAPVAIITTGISRTIPPIKAITKYEGKGISYCATCDGFFYRNKKVGVLGSKDYALSEANHLVHLAKEVVIYTNGIEPTVEIPNNITLNKKKIVDITGETKVETLVFEDGSSENVDGLFIAYAVAGSFDFAKKLGAQVENSKIIIDNKCMTNVPGLFAAGDCTGGMLQMAKAIYEGAQAGQEAAKLIRVQRSLKEKANTQPK
jgi:thioredoxin reductase (NADPH)